MNYPDCSDIIQGPFIVIHHRVVSYGESQNLCDTKHIIDVIQKVDSDVQIIIFSSIPLHDVSTNISVVHDISTYASLMNHTLCKAVFTQFSGGGQLSQYCHNKKIFVYCKPYPFYPNTDIHHVITEANAPTNLYNKFDFKIFTDSNIYIFRNINAMLQNIHLYYVDVPCKRYLRI